MDPTVTPYWMREPLKAIAWVATAIISVVTVALELATTVEDLLPDDWRAPLQVAIGIAGTVMIGATRVLAVVGRGQVYAPEGDLGPTIKAALAEDSGDHGAPDAMTPRPIPTDVGFDYDDPESPPDEPVVTTEG